MNKLTDLSDKIDKLEENAKPILLIIAIGCVVLIIGLLPFLIFDNALIIQIGITLIGTGTALLLTLYIILIVLLVFEMTSCYVSDFKKGGK